MDKKDKIIAFLIGAFISAIAVIGLLLYQLAWARMGDVNGDGKIDLSDVSILSEHYQP